jgi:hypothetical protein
MVLGVTTIGRVAIDVSLVWVAERFRTSIEQLNGLHDYASGSLTPMQASRQQEFKNEIIRHQESLRMSTEFLSRLIIDSSGVGGSLTKLLSSEAPLVPSAVMEGSSAGRGIENLVVTAVGRALESLQQQFRFNEAASEMYRRGEHNIQELSCRRLFLDQAVSLITVQTLVIFLREFIWYS